MNAKDINVIKRKINSFFVLLLLSYDAYACPKIIAHRGGKNEYQENTITAFNESLKNGANLFELDVQLSKDNVPVVFHPNYIQIENKDLGIQTLLQKELTKYGIITLSDVLKKFNNEIIIDFKSLPVDKLVEEVAKVVEEFKAWDRVIFYSTDERHLEKLKQIKPNSHRFYPRKETVQLLFEQKMNYICDASSNIEWIGFELKRDFTITEKFKLGETQNTLNLLAWDEEVIDCIKSRSPYAKIVLFGINSDEEYQIAKKLRVDYIMTDNPTKIMQLKNLH